MFTKQHYEAIATALQNAQGYCETDNQRRGVERARNELAGMFARDNGLFKCDRFEAACVPGANVRARTR